MDMINRTKSRRNTSSSTVTHIMIEMLEDRRHLSAGTLRIASYNINADTNGNVSAGPGLTTVLQGIGNLTINGNSQPIDILALQETTSNAQTVAPIVASLNTIYGAGTYSFSSFQAGVAYNNATNGNGPNALIYNAKTLTLVNTFGLPGATDAAPVMYRQVMRYQFRAIGAAANTDFYLYVSHYKAGVGTSNEDIRTTEASYIRDDEATLPATARVIYAGDFNTEKSNEGMFTTLMASGNGQAFDTMNPTGGPGNIDSSPKTLSFAPTNFLYRDDYEMVTANVLNDTSGLHYVPGSFQVFGNNGSLPAGSSVLSPSNTALTGLPNRAAVLQALTTATDHLPVLADYTVPLAVVSDPQTVTLQAESATLAGGTVATNAATGYTGTGFADFGGNGSSVQWSTTRATGGAVSLVFRYANGSTANRPLNILVNGVSVGTLVFAPTGSWNTWATTSISANLIAGANTVKAIANTAAGGANVDSVTINKTVTTVVTYQAENATLAGGTVVSSGGTGYTGTGFADFGGNGSSALFNVTRSNTGNATLTFRFANGGTTARPVNVLVNGAVVGSVSFNPTGSWNTWASINLVVSLLSGSNTIKLVASTAGGPNLDWISVG